MMDFIQTYGYQSYLPKWEEDLQNDMAAYFKWKKDYDVKVVATEIMVRHEAWRIATPLDIICAMNFGGKRIMANVNLKTGDKGFSDAYGLQACMEAYMFNGMMPDKKFKLKGSFCLRPKLRSRCTGDYELSKNHISEYSEDDMNFVGNTVVRFKRYQPKGNVKIFEGNEKQFSATSFSPYEWLTYFKGDENQPF